ncbi:MAG: bifunctional 5,10-methylenetetrahydrofolate dehydrogenase/5,10-methenyltetrahydrofolate cyclohydrolase [Clostridiales bacterium]|nr:bifunctional 5,10-methylenetetrahydrofolate dehydrogenase/5,10-methenyltetrahydrofolate cyclohydrolase [Clostridiales bacterium]
MSVVIKGADVAAAVKKELQEETQKLALHGIVPGLGIVRVGAKPDDLAYERSAVKKLGEIGIRCQVFELSENISQQDFFNEFEKINTNPDIHGILLFRPLPRHLDEETVKNMINPLKDVDCMSPVNIAKIFSGDDTGFSPCTPEAVMEILDRSGIDLQGKRTVVIGRSMVVGKPLSMLLLKKNATVTICHTKTKDLAKTCADAEVLIAAAGKAKMVTADFVTEKSIVIDVGINVDENGKLCGDVDFESVSLKAAYITPVPGGVGTVTSWVLARHVVRASRYLNKVDK